jgi:hypothetical protein
MYMKYGNRFTENAKWDFLYIQYATYTSLVLYAVLF